MQREQLRALLVGREKSLQASQGTFHCTSQTLEKKTSFQSELGILWEKPG